MKYHTKRSAAAEGEAGANTAKQHEVDIVRKSKKSNTSKRLIDGMSKNLSESVKQAACIPSEMTADSANAMPDLDNIGHFEAAVRLEGRAAEKKNSRINGFYKLVPEGF